MPAEIPARRIAGMWEQAVHASLLHGRIKNKFAFAVFVQYGVVVFDGYAAEGLAPFVARRYQTRYSPAP